MKNLSNENIVHVKNNNIEYLQFKKLLDYPEIVHCYTLSNDNFDVGSNDTYKEKVGKINENYKKLADTLHFSYKTILRPYQTHTDIVKCIDESYNEYSIFPKELENVDGLLTNKANITFSLSYADCTPIFLYDYEKNVIGNIHSGWQGTLKGIGKIAVREMKEKYNCNPKNILCFLGPHIKKCHFEVGEDVAKQFKEKYSDMENIIEYIGKKDNEDKYRIDTTRININLMQEEGLSKQNIIDSGICTVCNKEIMHSFRANRKRSRKKYSNYWN